MALVAYSDNSDMGTDSEEEEETLNDVEKRKVDTENPPTVSPKNAVSKSGVERKAETPNDVKHQRVDTESPPLTDSPRNAIARPSGVETIVDEDDDYAAESASVPSSGLFSSVPAPVPVSSLLPAGEEVEDEVVDVPTVETWKVTRDLKKQQGEGSETPPPLEPQPTQKKEKKKVKILIPSLAEFADADDDDEEMKEPPRKKAVASRGGSGLFSVLPEPKNVSAKEAKRSLVPHVLTKRPTQTQKPMRKVTKKPPVATAAVLGDASDEEEDEPQTGTSDFFSLSEEPDAHYARVVPEVASSHAVAGVAPTLEPLREEPRVPSIHPEGPSPSTVQHHHYEGMGPSTMALEPPEPEAPAVAAAGIDEATLMRLAGRRGRADAINFIDVNADDALLTKQEWMTKALSEEKPQHGFSRKREGLPTQKQKQKHQITYLAHQAKERELDLKNTWALNKMTKMQSQAKYGF